ncbi:hypothetical protein ACFV4K_10520 [Nocardia sp. NPDC059764]|uniref:aromatic-ring hydroxylase C-terminal domain-containing protein n=1 Tax=Nocardia sp. NPDC059764 TaxID=3346939 RepID=UPI003647A158
MTFPLQELTYSGAFVLIAGEDGAAWVDAARKLAESSGIRLVAVTVDAELADVRFAWLCKREISRAGAVLVRPDRFVGFRAVEVVEDPLAVLSSAMERILAVGGPGAGIGA